MGNDFVAKVKKTVVKGWDKRLSAAVQQSLFDEKRPPLYTESFDVADESRLSVGDICCGTLNDKGQLTIEGANGQIALWATPPADVLGEARKCGVVPMKVEKLNKLSGTADISVHRMPNE